MQTWFVTDAAPEQPMTSFTNSPPTRSDGADVLVVPDSVDAPRLARAWLADRLDGLSEDVVSDALILTSELVTNAVVHGRPEATLSMLRTPRTLRVAVADHGQGLPVVCDQSLGSPRVSGRGLLIVNRLAAAWGVDRDEPSGKTVWFTLATG